VRQFGVREEVGGRWIYARGMARSLRNFEAGIYHVAAHGSDTRSLFRCDSDRTDFLERLGDTLWQRGIELLAYVMMGNHYHSLVSIPDARLSEALQRLHTEYSRQHNRTHRRSAHLFRAHCLTRRIKDDDHLLATYRYLARNPVAAGLVDDPLDWPWSSARVHAGIEPAPIPLNSDPLRAALGDSPHWRERYRELIQALTEETRKNQVHPPPPPPVPPPPLTSASCVGTATNKRA
jgi:REP element-mobilizing transposase RayT